MTWSIISILMLFGALQGLVIVIILFFKKVDNKKARLFLGLILFGLSMNLLYYFFHVIGLVKLIPEIKLAYLPWSLLSAISFYLYISFISPFKKRLSTLNKVGFIPFLLFSIILITVKWYNYFSIAEHQIHKSIVSFIFITEEFFGIIFSALMGYLAYKKLNKIEIEIEKQFSNYNKTKLQFHKRFIVVLLMFCIVWCVLIVYCQIFNIKSLNIYFAIWLIIAFVIQWIAWTGFINNESLLPVFKNKISYTILKAEDILAKKKTIFFDKSNIHYKSLIILFEKEQLFLNPELSLEIVSNKLGISKSYLSALINQTTNENFYHFVNSYRIAYLISLFKAKKHKEFTILSLAFESGFSSKSTFQAFFKKIKGKTPTQFIKQLELNDSKVLNK